MDSTISLDGLTPALADLLHVGAVHRRRVREMRSSEIDRAAFTSHLHRIQCLWPAESVQRQNLETSILTVITWIEAYVQTGDHAEDLDAILDNAFMRVGSSGGLSILAGWVREVNAADTYVIVRIGEQDLRVAIEDATRYLPWWILAEDVLFSLGLTTHDAERMQQGEDIPIERWRYLDYDQEQLLDDDVFLAEGISSGVYSSLR